MVTHINWWVIIPCLVSSVVVTVLAHNHKYGQLSAVSAGPINLFIMGTGINLKQCSGGCWITNTNTKENQIKFYKLSSSSSGTLCCLGRFLLAGLLLQIVKQLSARTRFTSKSGGRRCSCEDSRLWYLCCFWCCHLCWISQRPVPLY